MKRDSRASFVKAADGDTSLSESESDSEEEQMHGHDIHGDKWRLFLPLLGAG
jgi:hypothetical protein